MEIAVVIAIITGVSGIVSSLFALWGSFHRDGKRNDAIRQADLTKQADQITDGLRGLLADQTGFLNRQIADRDKTISSLRDEITRLKGENHA